MLKNSGKIQKKDLVGTPFHDKQTPLEENYGYEFVKKAITAVLFRFVQIISKKKIILT